MSIVRPRFWVAAPLIGWTLACNFGSKSVEVVDTDQFAPDPTAQNEEPLGPGGHLASDLRGVWIASVRPADQRKLDVMEAGRDGEALETLDPPLAPGEEEWFIAMNDHLSENYHWWFCATHCRVEIRDSAFWLEGYLIYEQLGSGLMRVRIEGRDVYYDLEDHDPNGREGLVHLRMNKEWTEFRVIHLELEAFDEDTVAQLLQMRYYRRSPEWR